MDSCCTLRSNVVVIVCVVLSSLTLTSVQGKNALLIIDVQECFLPGGSLVVKDGEQVIPVINRIRKDYGHQFAVVAISKDWHLPGHISFASAHPGKNMGDKIKLRYTEKGDLCQGDSVMTANFPKSLTCDAEPTLSLDQILWPDHCIQNVTSGPTSSNLDTSLMVMPDDVIIEKGTRLEVDAYSAFFDNGRFSGTKLESVLRSKGITQVFVTGLALDYCVYFTSKDARELGFETYTVLDAVRGVNQDTVNKAVKDLADRGVNLITSDMLGSMLKHQPGTSSQGPSVAVIVTLTSALVSALIPAWL